nr:MAG TPA: hypothetical protein [Caudoviricetes sp.]
MGVQKFNRYDKVQTPKGVITIQSIQYDPKKDEYSYSILGPKSHFWKQSECKLVERYSK